MSLGGSAPARPLALTEELEKLEQSITLTLQEIDHNFSRAHRIVTSSILPIVEQYAEHSKAVWEGSKFWKQFFEASANVSLSGVEEREEEEEDETYTQSHDNASTYETTEMSTADETLRADGEEQHYDHTNDSLLDNIEVSGSTPRRPRPKSGTTFAGYASPYETLKSEMKGRAGGDNDEAEESIAPTTPGPQSRLPDMSMTPQGSSPFEAGPPPSTQKRTTGADHQALLHRVLDKNYRVQATPHKTPKPKAKPAGGKASWRDLDSPMSSPPAAAPQLRAEIFSSPVRLAYNQQTQTHAAPRTPGISVQTPAKGKGKAWAGAGTDVTRSAKKKDKDEITWESDSDEDPEGVYRELGMSPPKTIQFSMAQSRLLQTPAREASKQIVQDLLATAGVGFDDTGADESPSLVAMRDDLEDSF